MKTSHQTKSSHENTHRRAAEPTSPWLPRFTSLLTRHALPACYLSAHLCPTTRLCCKPMLATGRGG